MHGDNLFISLRFDSPKNHIITVNATLQSTLDRMRRDSKPYSIVNYILNLGAHFLVPRVDTESREVSAIRSLHLKGTNKLICYVTAVDILTCCLRIYEFVYV